MTLLRLVFLVAITGFGFGNGPACCGQATVESKGWTLTDNGNGVVDVQLDGQTLTQLHYKSFRRPILFPVKNLGGQRVTRSWPVDPNVAGEANDHPHHKSVWFGHGDVNGASFWDEAQPIQNESVKLSANPPSISLHNLWLVDGKTIGSDDTTITFGKSEATKGWWINYQVEVHADQQDLTFGDTKEGTFAIRTHPNLRLKNDPGRGVTTAAGHALNQTGDRDTQLWGKRSPWVAYWGPIEGQTTTLVMMDHPTNLRHPTTWHAREYGLVAANPFGLSYFEKAGKGAGNFTLKKGQTLTMHYRVLIADGQLPAETIEKCFKAFGN